jgi:hypothetical protein
MRPHQRGVSLPAGQPAVAVVLRDGEFGNGHKAEQIVRLLARERQTRRASVTLALNA